MLYFAIWISYLCFWPVELCFGLLLFRIKIKPLIPHILLSSFALSTLSVIIQTTSIINFLSLLLFIAGTLCIWFIIRLPFFHALLVMIMIEIIGLLNEWTLNIILPATSITFITDNNIVLFMLNAVLLILIKLIYCMIVIKFRLGFSFISRTYGSKQFFLKNSKSLKLALFLSFLVLTTTSILFFIKPGLNLYLFPVAMIGLSLLLRISYKWEMTE